MSFVCRCCSSTRLIHVERAEGFYCLPDVQALNDQLHAHAALASKEVNGEAAPFLQLADGRTFTALDVFVAQRLSLIHI